MPDQPLNIVHIFRAPVGGLFRHVLDVTKGQAARGHRVGLIADSTTGGERGAQALADIEPKLALGLYRFPMHRQPGLSDIPAIWRVARWLRARNIDVAHGHGAKGGAYARLAPVGRPIVRAYTPHGGSLLFGHNTLAGKIYLTTERFLMQRGNLYLFESAYSGNMFRDKIGTPTGIVRVVHNGVTQAEFAPVDLAPDATDLVFLGELRHVKGIDILIEALSQLRNNGRDVSTTLVGDGPDANTYRDMVASRQMSSLVRFAGAMPARKALSLGRIMVVPSRAESLPYVVLETAASGKPIITTNVGGIPEIFGPLSSALVPPQDRDALASAIAATLDDPATANSRAAALRQRVAEGFSTDVMVAGVLAGYRDVLAKIR